MTTKRFSRLLAGAVVLSLTAAACGGDDDDDAGGATTEAPPAATTAEVTTAPAATTAPEGTTGDGTAAPGGDAVDLSGVCPSPLVVQTDWFPEAEHGALYEMMGDDYTVDAGSKIVTGSLVTNGGTVDTGIDWEVRTGGPAIGFTPVASQVYTDDAIHLAYQNTESQVLGYGDTPMLSVVAPLEKNPQIIMWDPETYPDVETLADLGEAGVTINVFGGGVFSEVFVAQGIWTADQVDPSYDGSPQRFIAEGGAIAQQGFASAEPYNYEQVFEEWGKPVAFQLLHDAGFEVYSQTIAVRPDKLEELRPCLEQVVPIIQQAIVDYSASPDRANAIIIDSVAQFDDFWVYDEGVANFAVETMRELELIGNGPDDTVGNFDPERIQGVIDAMAEAGMEVPADLTAENLFTNEFIDDSIGF